jgi:hypothetical protein
MYFLASARSSHLHRVSIARSFCLISDWITRRIFHSDEISKVALKISSSERTPRYPASSRVEKTVTMGLIVSNSSNSWISGDCWKLSKRNTESWSRYTSLPYVLRIFSGFDILWRRPRVRVSGTHTKFKDVLVERFIGFKVPIFKELLAKLKV